MPPLPARQRSAQLLLDLPRPLAELSLDEVWAAHQQGLKHYRSQSGGAKAGVSWLSLKHHLARRLLANCNFCAHLCQVDRSREQLGYCRLGSASPISGSYLHQGEEAPISPTWALFFSGCTMHCVYCHNWRETFHFERQAHLDLPALLAQLQAHQGQYQTLSLIGGTPEPHLHTVLELAEALPAELKIPLVFNHNATLSAAGLLLMEGVIDIYLPDFKHGNDRCAWQLTKIPDYVATVRANLSACLEQGAAILVRHLVLPGHLDCCTLPILEQLARDFAGVAVNVMFQYRPMYRAESLPGIDRPLQSAEQARVTAWVQELGLRQVS